MIVHPVVTVSLPKLTKLTSRLSDQLDSAVRRTAVKLQKRAIERLNETVYSHDRLPKPTGALRASVYVRTSKTDTYREAMLEATSLRAARDGAVKLSLISPPADMPPKLAAWVGVGMQYGIYIEVPTRGRPGTYYMAGAAADVRQYFLMQVRDAIVRAGQGGTIDAAFDQFIQDAGI